MLYQFLSMDDVSISQRIALLICYVVVILLSLTVHEMSHAFAAYGLGDRTAKEQGRLTFNPLAHLDPIGFLMLLLVGFGYAKPVPINTRYFKKPKRDIALTSLAGPGSNLLLAAVFGLVLFVLTRISLPSVAIALYYNTPVDAIGIFALVVYAAINVNIGFALFNLIPIPPLDGSNVLAVLLPPNTAAKYLKIRYYTQYIFLGVIALSWLARYGGIFETLNDIIWFPLTSLCNWLLYLIRSLAGLPL